MIKNQRIFESLIGKHGLINNCFTRTPGKQFFPKGLNSFAAKSTHLDQVGCLVDEIVAGGTAFNDNHAIEATFGEFIERFVGASPNFNQLTFGSYKELTEKGIKCFIPNDFKFYADWQYKLPNFPFVKFNVDDQIYWVKGNNFRDDEEILVPDFLTYWVNLPKQKKYFMLPTSNGLATGSNLAGAIQSGFLETMERNAFSYFWYYQKQLKFDTYTSEIILNNYPDPQIQLLFKNPSIKMKIFDLGKYSPVETIVVFFFFTYKGTEYYSLGASSRFSKLEALKKACIEAYQVAAYATEMHKESTSFSNDYQFELHKINNFEKHYLFYNHFKDLQKKCPVFKEALGKKSTCETVIHFDDKLKNMEDIKNLNHELIYIDLSNQSMTGLPWKVVKVLMPEFVPITGNHNFPFLGNYSDKNKLFLELPHCFP